MVELDETTADLVHDMLEVMTSFGARLCGRRGARHRPLAAVKMTRRTP